MVLETPRLRLEELSAADAQFMLGLLNEPSFLQFIGDRGVRTLDQAREYILDGPVKSYRENGFGMYLVRLKSNGAAAGVCGLVRREGLVDIDIGFAFKPDHWSKGYANEAADAVLHYAHHDLGIHRIVAITDIENHASGRVLEKIGMRFERLIRLTPEDEEIRLFVHEAAS